MKTDLVINAAGKYLLPGLINLHVHINRRHLSRQSGVFRQNAPVIENLPDGQRMLFAMKNAWFELMQGITTLRDLSSVGRTSNLLRDAINTGIIKGPRLICCGLGIASTGGHETHRYTGAVQVDGPFEVAKAVRLEIREGADFIKLMVSGGLGGMPEHEHPEWTEFTIEEISAGVQAAHSHKKKVTVHAMGNEPVLNALRGGVDGIEHGAVLSNETLDIMADRNVYYIPTMSGITAVADKEAVSGDAKLAALIQELVVLPQRESVRNAYHHGILIGTGSDTLGNVHEELKLMIQCGMSVSDAIKTATSNAGKILGLGDCLGCIKEGYIADLLLVSDNPLENIENLKKAELILFNGQSVSHEWLCNE